MGKWSILGVSMLLVLLFPFLAQAEHFQNYTIIFTPVKQGIQEDIALTLIPEQDTSVLTYTFDHALSKVKASSENLSDFDVEDNTLYVYDSFRKGSKKDIAISLVTKDLLKTEGDVTIFSFTFNPPEPLPLKIIYKLPVAYVLAPLDPAVSPAPKEMKTDGRETSIIWEFDELNESTNIIVIMQKRHDYGIFVFTIAILILVSTATILIILRRYSTSKEAAQGTLSEDENKIIALLSEDMNRSQKDLVLLTGFSKVKMSKIIRRLEEKGVVEKKPYMTTNKFVLHHHFKQ